MELNEKQTADFRRLRAYFPYRLFFLVTEPGEIDGVVWALRDKRLVNEALRRGATVLAIS